MCSFTRIPSSKRVVRRQASVTSWRSLGAWRVGSSDSLDGRLLELAVEEGILVRWICRRTWPLFGCCIALYYSPVGWRDSFRRTRNWQAADS